MARFLAKTHDRQNGTEADTAVIERIPFGYDIVLDGNVQRLIPNEAEQATIARIKAMRRDGATLRAIGAVTNHGRKRRKYAAGLQSTERLCVFDRRTQEFGL